MKSERNKKPVYFYIISYPTMMMIMIYNVNEFAQDENSPSSQLKHFWMSTECSQNVHWNPDFRHCSVTFQWTFRPTECCWMAGTFQWPFSIFFFFRVKNSKNVHQIRGIKLILLWFTTHEIKKNKKIKNLPRARVEPGYSCPCCSESGTLPLRHAASYH